MIGAIKSSLDTERYIEGEEGHVVAFGHTWGRVRATGREFGVPETHLWTVKEGKVVRIEAYIDTPMMRGALSFRLPRALLRVLEQCLPINWWH